MNVKDSVLRADSSWSLYCWINSSEEISAPELVAGLGSTPPSSRDT